MNYTMVKNHEINNKLSIENNITQLLNSYICIYIICDTFLYDKIKYDVIDLFLFLSYMICNMLQLHMGLNKLNICICKPQMSNTCTKCIFFMFLGIRFLKMSSVVNLFFKFNVCICIFIQVQRI
jgi:hypothetical protein